MDTNNLETHKVLPYLVVFRLVAKLGSFQAAANQLQLPRPSVSKKIAQLENMMGQRLIQRTTRKLALTESGENLLRVTDTLPSLMNSVDEFISQQQIEPSGVVKISCSTLIGHRYLLQHIKTLIQRFPDVQLDLSFDDNNVDLLDDKIDIAIRIGHLPDSPMVARTIGYKSWCFVTSPEYLHTAPMPIHPREFIHHQCLVFKNKTHVHDCWPFKSEINTVESVQVERTLTSDDARALVEMLKDGLGIAMIDPNFIEHEIKSGELVKILPDYCIEDTVPIQLVCLGKSTRTKASKVIWEELAKLLPPHFMQKNSAR
ncbi:LysR family transcriptional regulator [Vibrio sp. T187]|uniref:LysR family transcriptional regulator n=1 Tax=Vibrio TaxID=662 RepID=UPI0010C995B8|nr:MULTISPECIES: LysR family transcriptional regulator [Vibrio]MBW3696415.1 LysR family transcriptional regulator [Vibrio sp. T187]